MNEGFEVNKVDGKELAEQMVNDIREGRHVELLICVGKDSTDPICLFKAGKDLFKEIGILYACLEETKKTIERKYPASVLYAKECLELNGSTEIDVNK